MRHIYTTNSIVVVVDSKTFTMWMDNPKSGELMAAIEADDINAVRLLFGHDPLLDQFRIFGGDLSEEPVLIKNQQNQFWKAPGQGVGSREEAFIYLPIQIRAVIGPQDIVEFVHI